MSQPGTLLLHVDTERPDATNIAAELIGWLLNKADGPVLTVEVFDEAPDGASAAYPAPYGAYRKVGFTSFVRSESFRLTT